MDYEIQSDLHVPSVAVKEEVPSSGKKAKQGNMDTMADGFKVMQQMDDPPGMKHAKFDMIICDQQTHDCEDERQAHHHEDVKGRLTKLRLMSTKKSKK